MGKQDESGKQRTSKQEESIKKGEQTKDEIVNLEDDNPLINQLVQKMVSLDKSLTENLEGGFSRNDMKGQNGKFYGKKVDKAVKEFVEYQHTHNIRC